MGRSGKEAGRISRRSEVYNLTRSSQQLIRNELLVENSFHDLKICHYWNNIFHPSPPSLYLGVFPPEMGLMRTNHNKLFVFANPFFSADSAKSRFLSSYQTIKVHGPALSSLFTVHNIPFVSTVRVQNSIPSEVCTRSCVFVLQVL